MSVIFKNKKVSVVGIGISNIPLIDYLYKKGALITARDKKDKKDIPVYRDLINKGIKVVTGDDYLENIDDDYIFRSPGIRPDIPEFKIAEKNGSVITSEMELFFDLCPAHILGITGSDGKTTTTTICSEFLKKEFGKVYVGGNIGSPLLPYVENMTENDWAVVELSSFQLMSMKKSPEIAIITNISPNHLNWHTDMEEYQSAKENIYKSDNCRRVVLNTDNKKTKEISEKIVGKEIVSFGSSGDIQEKDGFICHKEKKLIDESVIILPGHHNKENYMAAAGALYDIVSPKNMNEIAASFGGVAHRLELVAKHKGVSYYNSSIDSSPTRTIAALSSFNDKNTVIILGGYDKNVPFHPLAEPLSEKVKKIILTGATADKIRAQLLETEYAASLPEMITEPDFKNAVITASNAAADGDRVILSPACASFDAFPNFEKRGEFFVKIVREICNEQK